MVEVLVFSLCVADAACDEAFKAYYAYEPRIKIAANKVKDKMEAVVGETVFYLIPPVIAGASGLPYQIKITKEFSLGHKNGDVLLIYKKSF